jgi:hypothetical protein
VINKKINTCDCGRPAYGFKQCNVCRRKKYITNQNNKKNKRAEKESMEDLDNYYRHHIQTIHDNKAKCAECGTQIINPTKWNVCHILPKEHFPSVRSLIYNAIYLCRDHHAQFDSTYENAQSMKIWVEVKRKAQEFIPLVKEKHKILHYFQE